MLDIIKDNTDDVENITPPASRERRRFTSIGSDMLPKFHIFQPSGDIEREESSISGDIYSSLKSPRLNQLKSKLKSQVDYIAIPRLVWISFKLWYGVMRIQTNIS